jgi:hypothetical protein
MGVAEGPGIGPILGVSGAQGAQGPSGGAQGAQGSQGGAGAQGAQGTQGNQGNQGSQGSAGGGGWPTVNGTGAGNLTAATGSGDTTGYNFTDAGSGGFNVTTAAGGFNVRDSGGIGIDSTSGIDILATGGNIILRTTSGNLTFDSVDNVAIHSAGTGSITINTTGGGASTGITLQAQATDVTGITLNAEGGAITIETTGGGATTGINITTQASDTGGLNITANSGLTVTETQFGMMFNESAAGGASMLFEVSNAGNTAGMLFMNSGTGPMNFGNGSNDMSLTTGALHLGGITIGLYAATAVAQPAAITPPSGGAVVDTEARAAIVSILNAIGAAAGGIGITA